MKIGNLIKFRKTGITAVIVEMKRPEQEKLSVRRLKRGDWRAADLGPDVGLYVADGSLKGTACADGFTWISYSMLIDEAEVIS